MLVILQDADVVRLYCYKRNLLIFGWVFRDMRKKIVYTCYISHSFDPLRIAVPSAKLITGNG